jgi:hypothetical protein
MIEIGGLIIGIVTLILLYQQNRIAERGNRIAEGSETMKSGTIPAPYKRYWPMIAMAVLTALTWAAVGTDLYVRRSANWDNFALKQISGGVYKDETVPLDGYEYLGSTFDNVTFDYEGTAPARITDANIVHKPQGSCSARSFQSIP